MVGIEWRFTCCWISIGVCPVVPCVLGEREILCSGMGRVGGRSEGMDTIPFPQRRKARLRAVKELTS